MIHPRLASAVVLTTVVTGLALASPAQAAPGGRPDRPSHPTATRIDLGTLGGRNSEASAVDGSVVVGSATADHGRRHAFAYDLAAAEPVMRDLGTLGGGATGAVDVDGPFVVGSARLPSGVFHAFVYDLAAAEPVMRDLGTLGGRTTEVADLDQGIAVGQSDTVESVDAAALAPHAFAYDATAAEPHLQDLGTLGGSHSEATAVSGTIVVGSSATVSGDVHAFAYDLAADHPVMRDLGTLGGLSSEATDVEGSVVVGNAYDAAGRSYPFAYDLAAPTPVMENLGTLERPERGGTGTRVRIDDGVVAGTSTIYSPRRLRAFAYDLDAPQPVMQDLGNVAGAASTYVSGTEIDGDVVVGTWRALQRKDEPSAFVYDLGAAKPTMVDLGSWDHTEPADVSGDVVVGAVRHGRRYRATVWVLRDTSRPQVAFRGFDHTVDEDDGRVTIRLRRYGRADRAVTVRYATRSGQAEAGQDFVPASGTVRFARGARKASFTVRILDDRRREGQQAFLLNLSHPSGRALLGSPRWAQVMIAPSDQ
nr:Calx-beta domain-containing protein [Nocardioides luti]